MATNATETDNSQKAQSSASPVPPLINRILVFFYLITWANLLYTTYLAVQNTRDGDYSYLLPIGLTAVLFAVHFALNRQQYQKVGGTLSCQLWGYDEPVWRLYAFVFLWFALSFWANSITLNYLWVYTPLVASTFGMFPVRTAIPLVALQIVAIAYQLGLISVFQSAQLSTDAVIGISFGLFSFIAFCVLIILLIRSRIESEIVVQELQATKARLEEAMAREKELAVLRERDRMAREMHDILGHALVLVAVKIEAAQRLQAVDPQRASTELDTTKELVRQSMSDLRASLANLRSPALEADDKPLASALEEWASRTAREGGLAIQCHFEPGTETLPAPIQDALWRVGREAILNVVKHARARNVELHYFTKDGLAYLSVGDDGVGIPHLAEGSARLEVEGHYGFRGMRERLEALGGKLQVKPGRERLGTLVLASVPLPPVDLFPTEQSEETTAVPRRFGLFRRSAN